jgi:hypothetical protein
MDQRMREVPRRWTLLTEIVKVGPPYSKLRLEGLVNFSASLSDVRVLLTSRRSLPNAEIEATTEDGAVVW